MKDSGTSSIGGDLIFLKLGGSLITDKQSPRTARVDIIDRLSREIAQAAKENPTLRMVLGHGSGSYGHYSGKKHGTREGVSTLAGWRGFAEVWHDAATLNHLVMNGLRKANLPAVGFPPSSSVFSTDGNITSWDLSPIKTALEKNLLPVVYGDVVFDTQIGGTILSTEDLFLHMARIFKPQRILLAGLDQGVWEDYPECTKLVKIITPDSYPALAPKINSSEAPDVTGGMKDKVRQMLGLCSQIPDLKIFIFSGKDPGNIKSVLDGNNEGTTLQI
jgi:isopentenyl phosphate kinase